MSATTHAAIADAPTLDSRARPTRRERRLDRHGNREHDRRAHDRIERRLTPSTTPLAPSERERRRRQSNGARIRRREPRHDRDRRGDERAQVQRRRERDEIRREQHPALARAVGFPQDPRTAIVATARSNDAAYTSVSVAFCQTDDIAPAATAAATPNHGASVAPRRSISAASADGRPPCSTAENRFVATRERQECEQRAPTR